MAKTSHQLRQWIGGPGVTERDERGIAISVAAYLRTGQIPTFRDAKYLCFGIATPHAHSQKRIIEDEHLFTGVLSHVKGYTSQPKKFRRCYQGLFRGYLNYPGQRCGHEVGRRCWHLLRSFLKDYATLVYESQPAVDWTVALGQHLNLLQDNPCAPYGAKLLEGDLSVLDELRTKLNIDDETWIMSELVLSQIAAATAIRDDQRFKSHIAQLLTLLEPHPLLVAPGVAALLRRYAECNDRSEHAALREVSLRKWKSPWLEANKALWHEHIGEDATDMVSLWLKQRSIRDFFELLQADGSADKDRLDFWLPYAEAIDEVWLALGSNSQHNNTPDYRRIRQEMDGRWMRLDSSNHNADNAFLMKINGHLVIEFARQNNACHVFDVNFMPFKLGQKSVQGTKADLKNSDHPGHRRALRHMHGWQSDFASYLKWNLGVTPVSTTPIRPKKVIRERPFVKDELPPFPVPPVAAPKDVELELLKRICQVHDVKLVDSRRATGEVWVTADQRNATLAQVLTTKGFTFVNASIGWKKKWS